MPEVTDQLGQTVEPGDFIASAFRVGNIAELRVGKVLDYGENDNQLTLMVEWRPNGSKTYRNSFIFPYLKRFVRLDGVKE